MSRIWTLVPLPGRIFPWWIFLSNSDIRNHVLHCIMALSNCPELAKCLKLFLILHKNPEAQLGQLFEATDNIR